MGSMRESMIRVRTSQNPPIVFPEGIDSLKDTALEVLVTAPALSLVLGFTPAATTLDGWSGG